VVVVSAGSAVKRFIARAVSDRVRELSMLLKTTEQDRTMWFRCYQRATSQLAVLRAENETLRAQLEQRGVPS
jgi:hypothetical protein